MLTYHADSVVGTETYNNNNNNNKKQWPDLGNNNNNNKNNGLTLQLVPVSGMF